MNAVRSVVLGIVCVLFVAVTVIVNVKFHSKGVLNNGELFFLCGGRYMSDGEFVVRGVILDVVRYDLFAANLDIRANALLRELNSAAWRFLVFFSVYFFFPYVAIDFFVAKRKSSRLHRYMR